MNTTFSELFFFCTSTRYCTLLTVHIDIVSKQQLNPTLLIFDFITILSLSVMMLSPLYYYNSMLNTIPNFVRIIKFHSFYRHPHF